MLTARVAHRTVGRLRLKLDGVLSEADTKKFVNDLKSLSGSGKSNRARLIHHN